MIAAFVYGTLRIGHYNYEWASGDVMEEIPNVTAKGDIYFVDSTGGFPVADLDGSGTIHGDLLFYPDDSIDWNRIVRMETGAGYVPRLIEVTIPDLEHQKIEAYAWHYPYEPGGRKIEDGDWATAYKLLRKSA